MKRLLVAMMLVCGAFPAACGRPPEETVKPLIGPFVQFPKNPSKGEVVIVWETKEETRASLSYESASDPVRAWTVGPPRKRHEHVLKNLKPGVKYTYKVGSGSRNDPLIGGGSFTLPKPGQTKVRFAVFGDSRAYDKASLELFERMSADKLDLVIATGDYVHFPTGDGGNWLDCFAAMASLIRKVPFFPSLGDHDNMGEPDAGTYRRFFALPGNERYYSFDWGRCHFIALDLTWHESLGADTEQVKWLTKDLEAARGKSDFIFVYGHLPTRTCGRYGHDPDQTVRGRRILPLLRAHGVEMSFAGHDHTYQRWQLDGHTHVVTGGATRAMLYRIDPNQEKRGRKSGELQAAVSKPHYVLVEVDGKRATCTVKGLNGEIIEKFTVESRAKQRTRGRDGLKHARQKTG